MIEEYCNCIAPENYYGGEKVIHLKLFSTPPNMPQLIQASTLLHFCFVNSWIVYLISEDQNDPSISPFSNTAERIRQSKILLFFLFSRCLTALSLSLGALDHTH